MADDKKYYYLKLKDNFFEDESMIILENMQDGYKYSNILLKMYLRSLKNEGKLMFNDVIPYTPPVLAQITRHSVGDVEKAVSIFQDLGLIEVLDTGAIYITEIQNFIGTSSSEADRKRAYRARIEQDKSLRIDSPEDSGQVSDQVSNQQNGQMSGQSSDKNPPEYRDKSLEIREQSIDNKHIVSKEVSEKDWLPSVSDLFESFWKSYPKKTNKKKAKEQFTKKMKVESFLDAFKTGYENYLKYIALNEWYNPQELFRWIRDDRFYDEYDLTPPKPAKHSNYGQSKRKETLPQWVTDQQAKEKVSDWKADEARLKAEGKLL